MNTHPIDTCDSIGFGKEEVFTLTEVAANIRGLKPGKAADEDEIRPENVEGIEWRSTLVDKGVSGGLETWKNTKRLVRSFLYKSDRLKCTNYREISLLCFPEKVYTKVLKKKCREIEESKLKDGLCGFRPGRSTTDQIFTLRQILEKS